MGQNKENTDQKRHVLQYLLKLGKQNWRTITIYALLIGLGRVLLLSNVNFVGMIADRLCVGDFCGNSSIFFNQATVEELLLYMAFATVLGSTALLIGWALFSCMGNNAIALLQTESIMRVLRLPLDYFDKTPVGTIFARYSNDYAKASRAVGVPLGECYGLLVELLAMVALTLIADWRYALIPFFAVLINIWIYRLNLRNIRETSRHQSIKTGPTIAHFSETVRGSETISAYVKIEPFQKKFDYLLNDLVKARASCTVASQLLYLQFNAASALIFIFTALLGCWFVYLGSFSIGGIGVALTFVLTTSNSIQILLERFSLMESGMVGAERINEMRYEPIEKFQQMPRFHSQLGFRNLMNRLELVHRPSGVKRQKKEAVSLELKSLSMSYPGFEKMILKNLSFKVSPGEFIGVIGKTGAGKSTLFQAILSLYETSKGSILLDGLKVGTFSDAKHNPESIIALDDYRNLISYIGQEPTIFHGNLRSNLVGRSHANQAQDKEIIEALEKVGLGPWYRMQKNGLDQKLEEGGSNLSVGQRQLLAMARCILKKAPIVLMDEATSAIDPSSEGLLIRATEEVLKYKTRIIIAHRLSTVQSCDRVLWLHRGRIKMFDTPDIVLPEFQHPKREREII